MNTGFSFGCDPEIFLINKSGNREPISAYGLIPGTKAKPHPVECGAIQVDGMATEFNIDPVPSNDFEKWNTNIVTVMGLLMQEVRKNNPEAKFSITPTMDFGEDFLASQPDEAKELGCDPDFSAYTLLPNPRPDGDKPFRTASGHVHVGWGAGIPVDNEEHIQICADFVKTLDTTVGFIMTLIDPDPRRRNLYGKAGAFRPKPYGVEYRTPSCVWLTQKLFRKAVFDGMNAAVSIQKQGITGPKLLGLSDEKVQSIINEGKVDLARGYLLSTMSGYPSIRELVKFYDREKFGASKKDFGAAA